jgi:hypothetical protein
VAGTTEDLLDRHADFRRVLDKQDIGHGFSSDSRDASSARDREKWEPVFPTIAR